MSEVAVGATVLLFVVDPEERSALQSRLVGANIEVVPLLRLDDAREHLPNHPGALCFVEVVSGAEAGLAMIRQLRSIGTAASIVVLSGEDDDDARTMARDAGADDYLSTPIRAVELEMRISQGLAMRTLKMQAILGYRRAASEAPSISGDNPASEVDVLTGLLGPGPLQDHLDREYGRARRYGHPLSVLLIDVDKLGRYCKKFGAAAGDSALCLVADVLRAALRTPDIVARAGSDTFAVLATDTTEDDAHKLGDRLRAALAKESKHASLPAVTISVGIASAQRLSVARASDLLRAAERATAEAKRSGRDRCCVAVE